LVSDMKFRIKAEDAENRELRRVVRSKRVKVRKDRRHRITNSFFPSSIRMLKSSTMRWTEYVARMWDTSNPYRVLI
jgi:hypothetical protein